MSEERRSLVTGVFRRVTRPGAGWAPLVATDKKTILKLCYLWPVQLLAVHHPIITFVRLRHDPELGAHARQGAIMSVLYSTFCLLLGFCHGLVGRLVSDWTLVTVICLAIFATATSVVMWGGVWSHKRATKGEVVEIPIVSRLAEYL